MKKGQLKITINVDNLISHMHCKTVSASMLKSLFFDKELLEVPLKYREMTHSEATPGCAAQWLHCLILLKPCQSVILAVSLSPLYTANKMFQTL